MRDQLLAGLATRAQEPDKVAAKRLDARWPSPAIPMAGQRTARPKSLPTITRDDLTPTASASSRAGHAKVVAVGDIDAATLARMLDQVFGELPAKASSTPVADDHAAGQGQARSDRDGRAAVGGQFGLPGIARKDPDFIAAFVLNQILGGGGFASRLTEEVREKRGLAYSVYSYLQPYRHTSIFAGGVATKNEEIAPVARRHPRRAEAHGRRRADARRSSRTPRAT